MKTLIVFLHGIGDNLMFTGVLREYQKEHKNEQVDLLVLNKESAKVWENNPNINKAFVSKIGYNPRFWNFLAFWLVDYWKIKKEIKRLDKTEHYNQVYIIKVSTLPEIVYRFIGYGNHKVERMASELSLKSKNLEYEIFPSESDKKKATKIISELKLKNFAPIHPFSRDPSKSFDENEIKLVINILRSKNLTPLIVGSLNDKSNFNIEGVKSCFGLSFGVLSSLLRRARLFIGTDSAIAHLAGTSNIPLFVISSRGSMKISHGGRPEWYLPYKRNAVYLQKTDINKLKTLIK